jgi:hypothetical protein
MIVQPAPPHVKAEVKRLQRSKLLSLQTTDLRPLLSLTRTTSPAQSHELLNSPTFQGLNSAEQIHLLSLLGEDDDQYPSQGFEDSGSAGIRREELQDDSLFWTDSVLGRDDFCAFGDEPSIRNLANRLFILANKVKSTNMVIESIQV